MPDGGPPPMDPTFRSGPPAEWFAVNGEPAIGFGGCGPLEKAGNEPVCGVEDGGG